MLHKDDAKYHGSFGLLPCWGCKKSINLGLVPVHDMYFQHLQFEKCMELPVPLTYYSVW